MYVHAALSFEMIIHLHITGCTNTFFKPCLTLLFNKLQINNNKDNECNEF